MNEIEKLKEKQEELRKEIEKLDIQINELTEQRERSKRWRGNQNEKYWYITPSNIVNYAMEMGDDQDNRSYEIGNYFRTKKEAEKAVEKMKIYTQLKDLALRLNHGREFDWENSEQEKYYIYYRHKTTKLDYSSSWCCQNMGQIYCLDSNFFDIAKREIGEENLKKII